MSEWLAAKTERAREGRLKRMANRQGLRLNKSRRAIDEGRYALIDRQYNAPVHPDGVNGIHVLDLDDVEHWLQD